MAAAKSVGRVGGLAFALGVGAAVFGAAGLAWADGEDSGHAAAGPRDRGAAAPARAANPGRPTAAGPAATIRRAGATAPAMRKRPGARDARPAPALIAAEPIIVSPSVVWDDGVLRGTLGASSALPLSYAVFSMPSGGGKLGAGPLLPLVNFGPGGQFTYIPDVSALTDPARTETFKIMALQNSPIDQFVEGLLGPVGEVLVPLALAAIHRIPVVGELLSPIIGAARVVTFTVNPATEAAGRPTAFTYLMPSFDGTPISVNYFPAIDVATGAVQAAPTVLAASGLACIANTDPSTVYGQLFPAQQFGSLTPGIKPLREGAFTPSDGSNGLSYDGGAGYNVVTWDPRGEFASGGLLEIDNPFFEGRDVSSIITWLTGAANPARVQVAADERGNPLVGMTGGSYGGGIQLTTVDPRIDAIVPEIAWNSLLSSLYPNSNQFKTGFGSILAAALAFTGARINPAIYEGILTGVLTGYLTPTQQAVLASVGPTSLLNQQHAATLLFQGIDDVLFPLEEAVAAARTIVGNPYDTPVKMVWFCGGHGTCNTPFDPEQDERGLIDNLKWLDQYVAGAGRPADTIPTFQWYDQNGDYWSADRLPFQDGFNQPVPYTATGAGGLLGLAPFIGGSGPWPLYALPFTIANAGPALNALNVAVSPPAGSQIVGAPTISFSYRGLGTSRTVYAQLVDNSSRLVLGNITTPIPVVLDGRERTVSIPLENVVYTAGAGDSLTLQITSSALNYENFTSFGLIDISDVRLDLPLRAISQ